jgi:hypothetical protein
MMHFREQRRIAGRAARKNQRRFRRAGVEVPEDVGLPGSFVGRADHDFGERLPCNGSGLSIRGAHGDAGIGKRHDIVGFG